MLISAADVSLLMPTYLLQFTVSCGLGRSPFQWSSVKFNRLLIITYTPHHSAAARNGRSCANCAAPGILTPDFSILGLRPCPRVPIMRCVRQCWCVPLGGTRQGTRLGKTEQRGGTNLASPEFSITHIRIDLNREFQIILILHRQGNLEGRRPAGGR